MPHHDVTTLAVLADEPHARRAARAIGDLRRIARAVEHRAQVVRHATVDGDPGRDVVLDRDDAVERDDAVGDERATGLDQQPLARAQQVAYGADDLAGKILDRRRLLLVGVGDAEAAADVIDGEVAERGDRRDRRAERFQREQVRADVEVQPAQLEAID